MRQHFVKSLILLGIFLLFLGVCPKDAMASSSESEDAGVKNIWSGVTFSLLKVTDNPDCLNLLLGEDISISVEDKTDLSWTSSDPSVASVDESGKIRALSSGSATISVSSGGSSIARLKVNCGQYAWYGYYLRMLVPGGYRLYRCYRQDGSDNPYIARYGCVETGICICASAFGDKTKPLQMYNGREEDIYSDLHALSQEEASLSIFGKASISIMTATQIFENLGIAAVPVYEYDNEEAIEEIRIHLLSGKPVLIKANNNNVNGIMIANSCHAMVLIGIDDAGNVICIDTGNGEINHAHGSNNTFELSLEDFIINHTTPASGNYMTPFVISMAAAGGYILVG